jgi:hypothetical protein
MKAEADPLAMISSLVGCRVAEIRRETFGDDDVPRLAERLGLPTRTWRNYEAGVVIRAPVLPEFIALTGASPGWRLTGEGDKLQGAPRARDFGPGRGRDRSWLGAQHG